MKTKLMNFKQGLYEVIGDCLDSQTVKYSVGDIVYVDVYEDGYYHIASSDSWIAAPSLLPLPDYKVTAKEFVQTVTGKLPFQRVNYIFGRNVVFKLDDLREYLLLVNKPFTPKTLIKLLINHSNKYECVFARRSFDLNISSEETAVSAILLYVWDFVRELDHTEYVRYINDLINKSKLHIQDRLDVSLFGEPLIVWSTNISNVKEMKDYIATDESQRTWYIDLMGIGIEKGIRECITNVAYELYCGSPFNERDTVRAEPLLLRLVNEFNDEYAMNTLGYIYYYHRNDDPQHYQKAAQYFSMAAMAGVTEATYKYADILEKGLTGIKNYDLAFELICKHYRDEALELFFGNYNSKFADLSLRMGIYYTNGFGVEKNPEYGYCHLLNAKAAIEERMANEDYIGDQSVLNRINKELEKYNIENRKQKVSMLDTIHYACLMFFNYHYALKDIVIKKKVLDKCTILLSLQSDAFFQFYIPLIYKGQSILKNRIDLRLECGDADEVFKEVKKHSFIAFHSDEDEISLYIANKKKVKYIQLRGLELLDVPDIN